MKTTDKKNNVVFIIVIIAFVLFLVLSNRNRTWDNKPYFKNKIEGIVEKKFRDNKNHLNKTIVVNDNIFVFTRDSSNFYEFVEVGDSIFKTSNTMNTSVYRREIFVQDFEVLFE